VGGGEVFSAMKAIQSRRDVVVPLGTAATLLLLLLNAGVVVEQASAFTSTARTSTSSLSSARGAERRSELFLQTPSFLKDLPNPFASSSGNKNRDAFDESTVFQPFDGSDASLINQAKRLFQTDLGLTDPSLLDDTSFGYIGPNVDDALSKTDYLAAGRFFNLRRAFPDLDYRPHDFRIVEEGRNGCVVRCTCRVTGTMRGELRLRDMVLGPTGVTMRCPPEAVSVTIERATGKVTKLVSGFCLDRLAGNTGGTTGVQAASTIAGELVSPWELFPPAAVLGRVFARPAKPIPDTANFMAPFPETVMVQLVKGVIASNMAANDPTLLSDDFTFCTPTKGPIRKAAYLNEYAAQELAGCDPNFSNFRVDPYDPVRVCESDGSGLSRTTASHVLCV
jgi:hypothetical protein